MKKTNGCREAEKIGRDGRGENLETHIDACAECLEARKVAEWMQKFAAQTAPPQNLRAPGFLLLKARLSRKQADANRAVKPIAWMQATAIVMLLLGVVWLEIKIDAPIFSTLSETFALLASVSPLFIFAIAGAALICFAFAYKMRGRKN
jgi:hypothetical protein